MLWNELFIVVILGDGDAVSPNEYNESNGTNGKNGAENGGKNPNWALSGCI